jgi:hypothetical protein
MLAHQHADLLPVGAKRPDRRRLVLGHEPAVADHVGGEDRGELAFDGFAGHGAPRTDAAKTSYATPPEPL